MQGNVFRCPTSAALLGAARRHDHLVLGVALAWHLLVRPRKFNRAGPWRAETLLADGGLVVENAMEPPVNGKSTSGEKALSEMQRQARARALQSQLRGSRLAQINRKLSALLDEPDADARTDAGGPKSHIRRVFPEPPIIRTTNSLTH